MKILQILVLIFVVTVITNAQIDCAVTNTILVKDYDGNIVNEAKVDVFLAEKNFKRTFVFSPQKTEDNSFIIKSFIGNLGTGTDNVFSISGNYWLKVTADNFKETERKIEFKRCTGQEITIILEKINQKIKLTGVVYDANGAVVVGTKVKATNKKGESFEVTTNDSGVYLLNLLPDFYTIEFEQAGFKKLIIKNFQVVNSTYGRINYDLVLEVGEPSSPYAPVIKDSQSIETIRLEISDKILQKSLENLPKEQNKTKRKNKINKQ